MEKIPKLSPMDNYFIYLAVKKLSVILREIKSKHYGDIYCLNCLHSFTKKQG